MSERVKHPKHYNKGIEMWDYAHSHNLDFFEGNIVKYVTRWKDDDNGFLTVKFVLEGDESNTHRVLESDEYYYWVDDNYNDENDDEVLTDEWDEENYHLNEGFNFIQWKDYNHSEEIVIEFIKDNFLTKEELPKKIKIQ